MSKFPHLKLKKRIDGDFRPKQGGGPKKIDPTTNTNLQRRKDHGTTLLNKLDSISSYWVTALDDRERNKLPLLPNPNVLPVFLQIDTQDFDIESLKSFGVEIISEEENGFIIGCSGDNFRSLKEKIQFFIDEKGLFKNKAAQLWQIVDGTQWRIEHILSEELQSKWDLILDDQEYFIDIGIACYVRVTKQPEKKDDISNEIYLKSLEKWKANKNKLDLKRDEIAFKRQTEFEQLIRDYRGELVSEFVEYEDSFSCRIKISGKGLKDITLNYQYLFEVIEYDSLTITDAETGQDSRIDPILLPPKENYPKVCIIDSGIQEEHRLLAPAIDTLSSKSFIQGEISTADVAGNGGHGTRVAGAVLYPDNIPINGEYQLSCFLQNAKILTQVLGQSSLPERLYPPTVMEEIVAHFKDTRIYNMSINSYSPCKISHMSQWASAIDKLMYEHNIIFILSAGNILRSSDNHSFPGIKQHLANNKNYPKYLLENSSRIANPAQSCFALTVGSICLEKFENDLKISFGKKNDPSSFSRTGLGLWGMIKPDVVEFGGDFVREKNENPNITTEPIVAPQLVKSTYHGGLGVGSDSVGTSYAAPKVAHILARLQLIYPAESVNLYRALLINSARLPGDTFLAPKLEHIRHYGYGLPDLRRATENSETRISLISSGELSAKKADVYAISIPDILRRPGEDFDILIEITLAYMAKPRRTRRRTKSYLSSWLEWISSKFNETYEQFIHRILQNIESSYEGNEDQDSIKWLIRERKDWSKIDNIRRQDSSLQKSWCIIKSFQLPEMFCIGVIGHKGWDCDLNEKVPYSIAVSFEALNSNINVYEMIRVENEIQLEVEVESEVNVEPQIRLLN